MIACISIIGMMTSCNKKTEDLIIGTWKLVSLSDGTTTVTSGYNIGSTWTYCENGDAIYCEYDTTNFRYTLTDNKIYIYYENELSVIFSIINISKTKMTIQDGDAIGEYVKI